MSLAIPGPKGPNAAVKGIETTEPAFGLPALWVGGEQVTNARLSGYTVVDALTVLVTHFAEVVRANAAEILTRKDVEGMLELAQKVVPRIVEELSGMGIHLGSVFRVLQLILAQRISVRDLPVILEALAAEGASTKDPVELAERIRPQLGRAICEPLRRPDGMLPVLVVDAAIEEPFFTAVSQDQKALTDPAITRQVGESIRKATSEAAAQNDGNAGDRSVAANSKIVRTRRAPRLAPCGGARLQRHSSRHRTQHRRQDRVAIAEGSRR